jgi:hypothetical protein
MSSGRRYQALAPLCVLAPNRHRIPPADQAYRLAVARGPPTPQAAGTV